MKILIVEDNEIEMENLKTLLEGFGDYKVVATAATIHEGIEIANKQQPDIIMLDIQLDCQNSLEHIDQLTYGPYIICSTLYTEHALQAFEVGVTDYLTKPITHEKLSRALNRIPTGHQPSHHTLEKGALPLTNGSKTQMVSLENITLVTADRDYSTVRDDKNSEFISTRRMREWGELLPPGLFATLDRSTIVNKNQIASYTRLNADRTATISFTNGQKHKIGSTARRRLKSIMET